jgi:hypothetical protein
MRVIHKGVTAQLNAWHHIYASNTPHSDGRTAAASDNKGVKGTAQAAWFTVS